MQTEFSKLKDLYEVCRMDLVVGRPESKEDWESLVSVVRFDVGKVRGGVKTLEYKRARARVLSFDLGVSDGWRSVEGAVLDHVLPLPDGSNIKVYGAILKPGLSIPNSVLLDCDWPHHVVTLTRGESLTRDLPTYLTPEPGLPLYGELTSPLEERAGLNRELAFPNLSLAIVLPDFRARLREVVVHGDSMTIDADRRFSPERLLIIQFRAQGSGGKISRNEYDYVEGGQTVNLGFAPRSAEVHLFDAVTHDHLDSLSFGPEYSSIPRRMKVVRIESNLPEKIKGGEGPTLEFKEDLSKGNRDQLLRAVSAFANSKIGGLLIVGVRDDSTISGFSESESEDDVRNRLINIVRDGMDPIPEFEVDFVALEEHRLTLVRVRPGHETPYSVKPLSNRIFVRAGASSRPATRDEIVKLSARSRS